MSIARVQSKNAQLDIYPADRLVHLNVLTYAIAQAERQTIKVKLNKGDAITLAARILEAAVLLPDVGALSAPKAQPVMVSPPRP